MRIAHYGFAALFVFAAAVQYNDPDPIRWIAIYVASALVSALAASTPASTPNPRLPIANRIKTRSVRIAAAIVGAVALLWAARISVGADHPLIPWRMFDQWEMKDVAVEETREIFGLLIVAAWMLVTALTRRNARLPKRVRRPV